MTRVLVVDDHPDNLYYLQALFQGHGFIVDLAANGRQALEHARHTAPQLIVSDLLMPEMDGYSLLRACKNDASLSGVPFIVYTATYTEPEDEALARRLGADAFVLKPAEPQVLLQVIRDVLNSASPPVPASSQHGQQNIQAQDDRDIFHLYSQALVRKLEQRSRQLEQANKALQEDIQRRVQAENALRLSEERFRLLAQATTDAAWDLNLQSGERWWGSGFQSAFGHSSVPSERAESAWLSLIHSDDRSRVQQSRRQAIEQGGAWVESYRMLRGNGAWAHVEDRGHVVANEQGVAIRMVGGLVDVSEKIVLQAQLERAQRLEAVGQLTGGVAHDFNNLLTVVLGNAQVLAEQADDRPDLKALAELILRAADRGATLTRQLLAFASKQALEPRAVDLHQLVADIQPLLQSAVGGGITIDIRSKEVLPLVMVDAAQLESALVNLAVNARDAMQGRGSLIFELGMADPYLLENAYGRFAGATSQCAGIIVSDTGCGIRPEHLDRVFEPFFTTKQAGRGSGLGLAMVFGFVRQSHGLIDVASSWGHGARFSLFFPTVSQPQEQQHFPVGGQTAHGGSETVLLVDDDEAVRQVLAAQLVALGYTVVESPSGDDALQRLAHSECSVDLLLTDVMMPGMTGYELARKAVALRPTLRVLYSSGYQGHGTTPEALVMPAEVTAPLLQKPYRRETLAASLRDALGQR